MSSPVAGMPGPSCVGGTRSEISDLPAGVAPVLSAVQKIERLVGHDSLDVEFAVTGSGEVHVLQVRPIAVSDLAVPIDDEMVHDAVKAAQRLVRDRTEPIPSLVGRSTRYSVMADWNPAEIVGTTPRALAASLYRYLVTDDVWARQRAEYGYRDVRPCPLLVDIAGHPYVDVRACFNSFVPAALTDDLATRLVEFQIGELAAQPQLHDKVEFAVLATCLAPGFDDYAARLRTAGFSEADIAALRSALRAITVAAMERLPDDLARLEVLRDRFRRGVSSTLAPLVARGLLARRGPGRGDRALRPPRPRGVRRDEHRARAGCDRSRECAAGRRVPGDHRNRLRAPAQRCGACAGRRTRLGQFRGGVRAPATGHVRHHVAVLPRRGRGVSPPAGRPGTGRRPVVRFRLDR